MKKQYPVSAWGRALKELEVILKAIGGQIKWIQAADISSAMKTGQLVVSLTVDSGCLDKWELLLYPVLHRDCFPPWYQ